MNLDQYQQSAAYAAEDKVAVTASPGSGKTTVLVARYNHLIESRGASPHNIAAMTFTRYSANELRARIGRNAQGAYIGTVHAFCLDILKQYSDWDFDRLTILDESETDFDIRLVLKDMNLVKNRAKFMDYMATVADGKADEYEDRHMARQYDAAIKALRCRMKLLNLMTYDMIISETVALLDANPDVVRGISGQYHHLLLDEAQDTDKLQWDLIAKIPFKTLFIVGDVDQSCYEWRNARPDMFLDRVRAMAAYVMPQTYRFGADIADHANQIIAHNVNRLPGQIIPLDKPSEVIYAQVSDYAEIKPLIQSDQKKYGNRGVIVLARTNHTLEKALDQIALDSCQIVGKVSRTSEYRTVLGYLKLAANPESYHGFAAIAAQEGLSDLQILEVHNAQAQKKTWAEAIEQVIGNKLPTALPDIRDRTGRTEVFDVVYDMLTEYEWRNGFNNPRDLVNSLTIQAIQDKMAFMKEKTLFMSIHGAKGLQWRSVYLIGFDEKVMPCGKQIEEERRIAFIAFTRAIDKLTVVSTFRPSSFVAESGIEKRFKMVSELLDS